MSARGITATLEDRDGFGNMFDEPHLSIAPLAIVELMRDWLVKDVADARALSASSAKAGRHAARRRHGADRQATGSSRRSRATSAAQDGLLFSIETRPVGSAPESDLARVPDRSRGPAHRARTASGCGSPASWPKRASRSLRLDGRSVGDSDGDGNGLMPNEEYYQEHIYDDIENVMEHGDRAGREAVPSCRASAPARRRRTRSRGGAPTSAAIVLLNLLQLRHDPEDDESARSSRSASSRGARICG